MPTGLSYTRREDKERGLDKWADKFFEVFANTGMVSRACTAARIGRETVQHYRFTDPDFAARYARAERIATSVLEDEAFGRAKSKSDTLLMFLLKARDREKYGDVVQFRNLSDEELIDRAKTLLSGVIIEGTELTIAELTREDSVQLIPERSDIVLEGSSEGELVEQATRDSLGFIKAPPRNGEGGQWPWQDISGRWHS